MSAEKTGGPPPAVLFTQLDMVTTFAPPGQLGVRVGTVTGAINGTITINSTFDPAVPPPNFKADGSALLVDTDGDQILFHVAFNGQFFKPLTVPPPATPPDVLKIGGSFTTVYTANDATGKFAPLKGQAFKGIGVAVLPAQNPSLGAAFTQIFGSLPPKGPK
jgi:hypothetical protein